MVSGEAKKKKKKTASNIEPEKNSATGFFGSYFRLNTPTWNMKALSNTNLFTPQACILLLVMPLSQAKATCNHFMIFVILTLYLKRRKGENTTLW